MSEQQLYPLEPLNMFEASEVARFGIFDDVPAEVDVAALVAEAREKVDKAHTELIRILSVGEQVRMSIPADVSRDTDLIIVAALAAGRDLADALEASSRPVRPNREALAKALWDAERGETNAAEWGLITAYPSRTSIRVFAMADALLATDFWQPAPEVDRERAIETATWALINHDTDVVDRGVTDQHYRDRRDDVVMVLGALGLFVPSEGVES